MKISNYSLNYSSLLSNRKMDLFGFLSLCRQLDLEGASMHIRNLSEIGSEFLKKIRRAYLDNGLSISMFGVSTNFGLLQPQHEVEFAKAGRGYPRGDVSWRATPACLCRQPAE